MCSLPQSSSNWRGGDNSNNVFGLASDIDFATLEGSVGSEDDSSSVLDITNERNTIGVFGSGLVELLSREITIDLFNIVEKSKKLSLDENRIIKLIWIPKELIMVILKSTQMGLLIDQMLME